MRDKRIWYDEVKPRMLMIIQRLEWADERGWAAILRKQFEEWTAVIEGQKPEETAK